MNKNDKALKELLTLLNTHPELIREIVFDPTRIRRLLKTKGARRLALGKDATGFLEYLACPVDGYAVAVCLQTTRQLCAKGTMYAACDPRTLVCGSRTLVCGSRTIPTCVLFTIPGCGAVTTPPCTQGTRHR
jgi:hypothetical protein